MIDSSEQTSAVPPSRRGRLRIYLGAAPGVGKTFAMLNEGRRRAGRGTDVVVAYVETHGRTNTAAQLGDLEVIPRRRLEHRGAEFEELDVEAVLARAPELALVDELAHTNVPGSAREKRWQDIEVLLDAGIDVLSTVNIQHLESVNDVVERITGVRQRETVPDEVVRTAEQVELVDMTPEALRRRLAHGNVYAAEKIDAALGNYFREGNLAALRELALLWVADQVDEALEAYRERHGITETWETRERVIVAVTGAPGSEHLIRRAARIAQRSHGELIGVHIRADTGLAGEPSELVDRHRVLLEQMGGELRTVVATDVAQALVDVARAENGTQIVLGASRRSRWQRLSQGSVINRVVQRAGSIDVHVISAEAPEGRRRLPSTRVRLSPVPPHRQAWGWALVALGLPLLTVSMANLRSEIHLPTVLLLYLLLSMAVALVGGVFPALAAVAGGFVLVDYFFTRPLYELTIDDAEVVIALLTWLLAAGIVCVLVDRVGRLALASARSRAEAEAMAALAGSLAQPTALPELVRNVRTTFELSGASLLQRDGTGWVPLAADGVDAPTSPEEAVHTREVGPGLVLAVTGRPLRAADQRVLAALTSQVADVVETRRLQEEAGRAAELAEANEVRTALLQAVSHDLRTPLSGIKASVSSLRHGEIDWSDEDEAEFLRTIEEEADHLDALVANLLDMSRLQAGALPTSIATVPLHDAVLIALDSLGPRGRDVEVVMAASTPAVRADQALLERVIGNLVDNALHVSPGAVRIEAGPVPAGVDVRIVDHGPGIAPADRERVFQPFQRLNDHGGGVGLGLAIARGFLEAMDGELVLEDTPGGGTTAVIRLPRAA